MRYRGPALLVVVLLLFVTPVLAHVPVFATDNASPETAYPITDPAKSWSIYDRLDDRGVAYYELDLEAGDRLRVSVFTPVRGEFTPSLVLASPSMQSSGALPDRVRLPDGYGHEVVAGTRPAAAEYEPFAPSSFYDTVQVDRLVDDGGRYLLAVYTDEGTGPVGLAVGREERFTPTEYVGVPLDLVRVHLWAGQHPVVVFGPLVAVLGVGLYVGRRRLPDTGPTSVAAALGVAGLLYVGTAAGTAVQMAIALSRSGPTAGALVTAVFVVVPLLLGGWLLRRASTEAFDLSTGLRLALVAVGVLGFATWAGLLVGPTLALAVAVTPRTGFGVSR
jgi:hypothetical protein